VRCAVSGGRSATPAAVIGIVEQRSLAVVRHDGFGCAGSGRRVTTTVIAYRFGGDDVLIIVYIMMCENVKRQSK